MPELPEVETLRRELEHELLGARIVTVVVTGRRSVRRHNPPEAFVAALTDRTITGCGRRGKYLVLDLDDRRVLVVHLRMSGQVLWVDECDEAPPKHTHVVLGTDRGRVLRFVDPRTFGEMFVTDRTAEGAIAELDHLGLEPLAATTTPALLATVLRAHRVMLKPFLLDQRRVVGIGNIYSDEILFRAGLAWDRRTNTLTDDEVIRLSKSMVEVLEAAIEARGSSLADAQYVDLYGRLGDYSAHHQVHARAGTPCPQCGEAIVREKVGGRSTYRCPECQR